MTRPFIMVAPTGARRGKSDHPQLPLSLDEIIATAGECHAAGADALHLHVRDADGQHSLDSGRYNEALQALTAAVPRMKLQITTESADIFDVPAQLACLETVRPQWASVAVREIAREPSLADRLYGGCAERGTEVQHILFDADDVATLRQWQETGIVRPDQTSVIFVLGRYSDGQQSQVADLAPFLTAMPDRAEWMVCAFGRCEHECLMATAAAGGSLRVGFENSITDATGAPHPSNAASVAALRARLAAQTPASGE